MWNEDGIKEETGVTGAGKNKLSRGDASPAKEGAAETERSVLESLSSPCRVVMVQGQGKEVDGGNDERDRGDLGRAEGSRGWRAQVKSTWPGAILGPFPESAPSVLLYEMR